MQPLVKDQSYVGTETFPDSGEDAKFEEQNYMGEINEWKKQLKRIANKRSLVIAAQLSGDSMDPMLKQSSMQVGILEQDIQTCKSALERGEKKIKADLLKSDIIQNKTDLVSLEKRIGELEYERGRLKDMVIIYC